MVKIFKGNLPQKINVVVDRKVIAVAEFNKDGVYETDNKVIIKELKEYGYTVEDVSETQSKEIMKPRRRTKDID